MVIKILKLTIINSTSNLFHDSTTYEGAVTSSAFSFVDAAGTTYNTAFFDDVNGTMRIFYLDGSTKILLSNNAGTVTYSNGHISLSSFRPSSFVGSKLEFTIEPSVNDMIPIRNQLFEIANTNVTIVMQDDAGTGTTVTSTSATGTVSSTTTSTSSGISTVY